MFLKNLWRYYQTANKKFDWNSLATKFGIGEDELRKIYATIQQKSNDPALASIPSNIYDKKRFPFPGKDENIWIDIFPNVGKEIGMEFIGNKVWNWRGRVEKIYTTIQEKSNDPTLASIPSNIYDKKRFPLPGKDEDNWIDVRIGADFPTRKNAILADNPDYQWIAFSEIKKFKCDTKPFRQSTIPISHHAW
ncbi:hypothetical protein DdX_16015 [Ditylenchus destructor]|uniref:Uncharacterized protein n=1 Tax=Ditylenchus destructor TaxID=166010 RepID=A0AAD4MTV5_9BILA|nr:hypothetical protein DdX_16015 [Ditylenchus destructor]